MQPDLDTLIALTTVTGLLLTGTATTFVPLAPIAGYVLGKKGGFKDRKSGAKFFWDMLTKIDLIDCYKLTKDEFNTKYEPQFNQYLASRK